MRGSRAMLLFAVVILALGSLAVVYGEQRKPSSTAPNPVLEPERDARVQAEKNKVPVRQLYEEMFTRGRYELLDSVFAKNCPVHFGDRTIRLQEAVVEGKGWRSAAPDLVMAIEQISVKGDMVNVVWTARGTHTGSGHGLKPTGRHVFMRSASRFRVVEGRIVEAWNEEYRPELFRQLGVSRTQAFIFFTAERMWTALGAFIPDAVYASIH